MVQSLCVELHAVLRQGCGATVRSRLSLAVFTINLLAVPTLCLPVSCVSTSARNMPHYIALLVLRHPAARGRLPYQSAVAACGY